MSIPRRFRSLGEKRNACAAWASPVAEGFLVADDDHGPLALQEILLAGCPTVGVRTGASFVRTGETGVLVDRLPPGRQCVETDDDVRMLSVFMETMEQAQLMDRADVRRRAAEEFDADRIADDVVTSLESTRLRSSIAKGASV